MTVLLKISVCLLSVIALVGGSAVRAQDDTAQSMLAAQIRAQGFACDKPLAANRDTQRSSPDRAVWLLECSNAVYRVSRAPDMGAKVERVDVEGQSKDDNGSAK